MDEEYKEKKDDSSYLDYILSLINYKIGVCYHLFFDFKSYYYNAGFYIGFGTLVLCLVAMLIFISLGMKKMNAIIFENMPNKKKLIEAFKEQKQKQNGLNLIFTNKFPGPPLKRKSSKNINKNSVSSDNLENDERK